MREAIHCLDNFSVFVYNHVHDRIEHGYALILLLQVMVYVTGFSIHYAAHVLSVVYFIDFFCREFARLNKVRLHLRPFGLTECRRNGYKQCKKQCRESHEQKRLFD